MNLNKQKICWRKLRRRNDTTATAASYFTQLIYLINRHINGNYPLFILLRNNAFNLSFGSVEYESPTRRKGIEAQTCEILLLRLFKSQGFAFCHKCLISKWDQGYDRVLHVSFKILLLWINLALREKECRKNKLSRIYLLAQLRWNWRNCLTAGRTMVLAKSKHMKISLIRVFSGKSSGSVSLLRRFWWLQ